MGICSQLFLLLSWWACWRSAWFADHQHELTVYKVRDGHGTSGYWASFSSLVLQETNAAWVTCGLQFSEYLNHITRTFLHCFQGLMIANINGSGVGAIQYNTVWIHLNVVSAGSGIMMDMGKALSYWKYQRWRSKTKRSPKAQAILLDV